MADDQRDRLDTLETLLEGHRNRLRILRSTRDNTLHFQRSTDRLKSQISKLTAQLAQMQTDRENVHDLIDAEKAEIERILTERRKLKSADQVAKLEEMRAKVSELKKEIPAHVLKAMFEDADV
jgi:Mg2+/Co2+ transporter CorB